MYRLRQWVHTGLGLFIHPSKVLALCKMFSSVAGEHYDSKGYLIPRHRWGCFRTYTQPRQELLLDGQGYARSSEGYEGRPRRVLRELSKRQHGGGDPKTLRSAGLAHEEKVASPPLKPLRINNLTSCTLLCIIEGRRR